MPYNGSGVYSAPSSSFNPAVADTTIDETDWNDLLADIETALSSVIHKAGQTTTTGSITFAAGIRVNNTGLKIADTNASHYLSIVPGSNITADRTFTLTTGDAARTLDMSAGNLTAGGGQIVFPASQNASADANTLDDYEEGTFTPTLTFGGGATGLTMNQGAYYTKIGNRVCYNVEIQLTAKGSSTGAALIGALPFTSANVTGNRNPAAVNTDVTASITDPQAYVGPSSTNVTLGNFASNAFAALTEANFNDTTQFIVSGHYRV